MGTTVDFAARMIDAGAIKNAGHEGVMVYLSRSRPGSNFGAKPVTREYCDSLRAWGLEVVSIWQYGKPGGSAPSDWTRGFEGGVADAREALETHFRCGGAPFRPIYFALDEDITLKQWNDTASHYYRGVASVLGLEWTGIYGNYEAMEWAAEDDVARWFWQTRAWSNGMISDKNHLYQRVVDTASNPGPKIDGSAVDVNDISKPDYGQWSMALPAPDFPVPTPAPAPELPKEIMSKPDFQEVNQFSPNASGRNGARITNFLFHTQEGGNGSPENLAGYLGNPNSGVSYHYSVGQGRVVNVVDTDLASWSVGNFNPNSINLCFAGSRASWSREQWLEIEDDIRNATWLAVQDAQKYKFSTEVIGKDYSHAREGISDHQYVTEVIGWGDHTDVGPNFPWDVVEHYAALYTNAAPAGPPPNAINDAHAANPWLGARLHDGELSNPDNVGRRATFEAGHIYWHPRTGAHVVKPEVFRKWARIGWEAGELGYPTTDTQEIPGGQVQGFENGAIYVQAGATEGFVLKGAIRDRWNSEGFESGPCGWPTSDEEPVGVGRIQRFEHAAIVWPNDTTAVLPTGR
jgi:N-acetyl-anhydromuramyl-L-alanine amidase AmpD